MNNRPAISFCAALAAAVLALPQATACIEVEPRHTVEFLEGSAEIDPTQKAKLVQMLEHADLSPGKYRVAVRGHADHAGSLEAKDWSPADRALADARARALSLAVRELGEVNCLERVAIGAAPGDAPPARVDAQGRRWQARALLVLARPGSQDTPKEGVSIETDCGPPAPPRLSNPATSGGIVVR